MTITELPQRRIGIGSGDYYSSKNGGGGNIDFGNSYHNVGQSSSTLLTQQHQQQQQHQPQPIIPTHTSFGGSGGAFTSSSSSSFPHTARGISFAADSIGRNVENGYGRSNMDNSNNNLNNVNRSPMPQQTTSLDPFNWDAGKRQRTSSTTKSIVSPLVVPVEAGRVLAKGGIDAAGLARRSADLARFPHGIGNSSKNNNTNVNNSGTSQNVRKAVSGSITDASSMSNIDARGMSVFEYLDAKRDSMIHSVLERSRSNVRERVRDVVDRRVMEVWEGQRKMWLDSVVSGGEDGGRVLGGSRQIHDRNVSMMGTATPNRPFTMAGDDATALTNPQQQRHDSSVVSMNAEESYESLNAKELSHLRLLLGSTQSSSSPLLSSPSPSSPSSSSSMVPPPTVVTPNNLLAIQTSSSTNGGDDIDPRYKNAIRAIAEILSPLSINNNSNNYNHPIATMGGRNNNQQDSNSTTTNNVMARTIGTCRFLADQYRHHVRESAAVHTAVQVPSVPAGMGGGLADDVGRFEAIEMEKEGSMNYNSASVVGGRDAWRRAYYCLRCGDALAACNVLTSSNTIMDPAIERVLSHLASHQERDGSYSSVFQNKTNKSFRPIPLNLTRGVSELYHRQKQPVSTSPDEYELACLALLCLDEPIPAAGRAASVVQTVEDYIYVVAWRAVWRLSDDSENEMDNLAEIGSMVKSWGPSQVDDGDSNDKGWAYTLPLLLASQFQSALTHLAGAGSVLEACHLALAISGATGEAPGDWDGKEEKARDTSDRELLARLIEAHAGSLRDRSPVAALEYLVRIPELDGPLGLVAGRRNVHGQVEKTAKAQVVRLVIETGAFEVLAGRGTIEDKGDFTGGGNVVPLDRHFNSRGSSEILVEAAEIAIQNGNTADAAELLLLARRYDALISLLNRELASRLLPTMEDDDSALVRLPGMGMKGNGGKETYDAGRKFWREAAERFHSIHLEGEKTYVRRALEVAGNESLGWTFQTILNLMLFFDRCYDRKWQSAWLLVESLGFLPKEDSDIPGKVEVYLRLDPTIKGIFHHVILYTMEALSQQHRTLKSNIDPGTTDANASLRQCTEQFRDRARILVTFSGLIQLNSSGETKSRITQMEAFMV